MIADMINNKNLNPVVTELFIRGRKLYISTVFITQSYFKVSKGFRLNSTQFLLWKFQIKKNYVLNHSSNINFKNFIKIYEKCTAEIYYFLVNYATLSSYNPLSFRKNLMK